MVFPKTFLIVLLAVLQSIAADDQTTDNTFCEVDATGEVTLCTPISNEKIANPCIDEHESCEYWASIGECAVNPNYMLVKCASSCKQCPNYFDPDGRKDDEKIDFGIGQETFGDNAEKKEIRSQIQSMQLYGEWYMKQTTIPRKIRKLCTNQLDRCAYYATKGLCESRVVFMMENCPLACMMCDKKKQFDECVGMRDAKELPLFLSEKEFEMTVEKQLIDPNVKVQTVDSYFLSLKDNAESLGLQFEYLLKPEKKETETYWMVRFGNFLTEDECNAVIDLGHEIGWANSTANETEGAPIDTKKLGNQKSSKSSKLVKCSDYVEMCEDNDILFDIMTRISKLTNIGMEHFEPAQIILYPESNGFQSLHHANDPHDNWHMAGPRVLSLYIPLSKVNEGGYLGFPGLDWLMVPPSPGHLILWPDVLSKDPNVFDERMGTEVLPVQGGDMYVLQIHVRQYDFEMAGFRGCA